MSTVTSYKGQIVKSVDGGETGGSVTLNPATDQHEYHHRGGGGSWDESKRAENLPGLMSSVRTKGGTLAHGSRVTGDCLVTIGGVQVSVDTAERRGYLKRDANGDYYDPSVSRPGVPVIQTHQQPVGKTEDLSISQAAAGEVQDERQADHNQEDGEPQAEEEVTSQETLDIAEDLETIKDAVGGHTLVQAVMELAAGSETISTDLIRRAASDLGTSEEVTAERVEEIRAAFEGQARAVVEQASGMDPDAVFEWAWRERPDEMKRAIQVHAHGRETERYKALAQEYLENLDRINPQLILQGELDEGVTLRQQRDGTIHLETPFGVIGWKYAVQKGIIRPHMIDKTSGR